MEDCNIRTDDHILRVYFQMVSSTEIIDGRIRQNEFPREKFLRLCRSEIPYLSDTELESIYENMKDNKSLDGETELNVFTLLKRVAGELLLICEDKPVCRYESLLRWHMLVRTLGEDLPVCAYLASRKEKLNGLWKDFGWETVISHDNLQLNRIIQRGASDNHFHLFGSAPAFQLTWLKLMNRPNDQRCRSALRQMERERRVSDVVYEEDEMEVPLEELIYRAALIRFYLFYFLYYASVNKSDKAKDLKELKLWIDFRMKNESGTNLHYTDHQRKESGINLYYADLQRKINRFQLAASFGGLREETDYMMLMNSSIRSRSVNHAFEGERGFLYQMLLGYAGHTCINAGMMQLFYAYLVIKGKFYREFVQVNDTVGFANFSIYNSRKNNFLYSREDCRHMVRHAVCETLEDRGIISLEMRITPLNSVKDYRDTLLAYDQYISEKGRKELLEKCFYVIHFPKAKEEQPDERLHGMLRKCRHQKFRNKIETQASVLLRFRLHAQQQAVRVRGIDACSQEIGCRPEVFAPVFRKLSGHVVDQRNIYCVPQLRITYHVGEDFLDVADGLRAIDEAIRYLGMKRGDRLGHATALGLDVKSWYQFKKYTISLPLHDYLDNVVWLYYKLIEFDITSCENLKSYLLLEYSRVFNLIYRKYLNSRFIEHIFKEMAIEGGESSDALKQTKIEYPAFDIYSYYSAWKLRGDDPACYLESKYAGTIKNRIVYRERIDWELRDGVEIRKNAEAVILYLMYHYSADVRHSGAKICVMEVPEMYVEGVERVQKRMQWMVARKGIGIETNPSSNFLISTMQSYQEHPISSLFNMGLTTEPNELRQSPQLCVSINTDDRGVFHTSLENEYALMGCAMEQIKTETGELKYQSQAVYEWLDRIREMGNEQSFGGSGRGCG